MNADEDEDEDEIEEVHVGVQRWRSGACSWGRGLRAHTAPGQPDPQPSALPSPSLFLWPLVTANHPQRKLNEEAAARVAAEQKGDAAAAAAAAAAAEQISQQEAGVQLAAARLESQLDREAVVERAREVSLRQQLEAATARVRAALGLSPA